ncbi:hypothetical protein LWI28_016838 [Acer negundo]|uniref:Uncharacterized protein n=1 Tax=Acer negundo TaxID=4023 RepID=A0AAD5NZT5_ACENE|nr:hypothetical protein LWI28_016838 [Acer negundo]
MDRTNQFIIFFNQFSYGLNLLAVSTKIKSFWHLSMVTSQACSNLQCLFTELHLHVASSFLLTSSPSLLAKLRLMRLCLVNDFLGNHQSETPLSTLPYFSPIASLLLSILGSVASLTTANEFPENLAIWKLKFVCCSSNAEAMFG